MYRFLIKSCFFTFPFLLMYFANHFSRMKSEGDLVRLGQIFLNPLPKSEINHSYHQKRTFIKYSEIDTSLNFECDVFTIGDSFSAQDSLGYQQFIENKGYKVIHYDVYLTDNNPYQKLIDLLQSNFFDKIKPKFIILESVERHANNRCNQVDFQSLNSKSSGTIITKAEKSILFSSNTLQPLYTNIMYNFQAKPKFSKTFKFQSSRKDLTSRPIDNVLIFEEDVKNLKDKNKKELTKQTISCINTIDSLTSIKGITLISMICPDKYDLYFPYLKTYNTLPKSYFYEDYLLHNKNYLEIDCFKILKSLIKTEQNVYYYDDSHWSPISANKIAQAAITLMRKQTTKR